MQIVIDIPEGTKRAIDMGTINQVLTYKVWDAIKSGTPLPEHHGDLKDVDAIINANELNEVNYIYSNMRIREVVDMLKCADTIIPATKEGDVE